MRNLWLPLLFLPALFSLGATEGPTMINSATEGPTIMNGVTLSTYEGFEKTWHLVTVRYRKDTGEMRFTYANDIAWTTLLAGTVDYPAGAVFAKTAVLTQDDPAFTSSAVPSGTRRFQFMVRDTNRFKATDGWGYALFDASGHLYPEAPKLQEKACAACHHIVPERGYVFSQPMSFGSANTAANFPAPNFQLRPTRSLPPEIRRALGEEARQVYLLQSPMQKFLFQGTLDEIKPALARKAAETGLPAALVSETGGRFSLVMWDKKSSLCSSKKSVPLKAITSAPQGGKTPAELSFCYEH